jgi:hypothetical protein
VLQRAVLRPLRAEAPAAQVPAHGGARQQEARALGEQRSDRIAGPQQPRQAKLVRGALADQRHHLLLLALGQDRLLTWTAAATLL